MKDRLHSTDSVRLGGEGILDPYWSDMDRYEKPDSEIEEWKPDYAELAIQEV